MDRLVNVLLQEETVAQERLAEIFGARPVSISVGILTDAETQTIAGSNWGTGMKRLGSLFNAIAAIIVSFSLSAWGADSPLDMIQATVGKTLTVLQDPKRSRSKPLRSRAIGVYFLPRVINASF